MAKCEKCGSNGLEVYTDPASNSVSGDCYKCGWSYDIVQTKKFYRFNLQELNERRKDQGKKPLNKLKPISPYKFKK